MTSFDTQRFSSAANSFLNHFGLPLKINQTPEALRALYRAFCNLPYENVSKIIRKYDSDPEQETPLLRTPEEVLEGYLAERLGGTCFSLTQCLASLLAYCGFNAWKVLGDMRHGPNIHCAVVVRLGRMEYLCDAGYLLPDPLPLLPRGKSILKGAIYTYLLEADRSSRDIFNLYTRSHAGEIKWRYRIRNRPMGEHEFEHYWRLTFKAPMNRQLILTRNLEGMQVYIHNHHLRLNLPEGKKNLNIRNQLAENIQELFGIAPQIVEQALRRLQEAKAAGVKEK